LKRVERDHAKEKQKLLKDKDAGLSTILLHIPKIHSSSWRINQNSKEPIIQSQPDKDKDGEPRSGTTEGQWRGVMIGNETLADLWSG
jgi:hypothetical protein